MLRIHRHRAAGMTLPEVITAIIVIMIVIGSVVSIFQGCMRTWRTATVDNMAQQESAWAVQRMMPDIHQGMSVTPGDAPFESTYIAIRLPNRIFDAAQTAHFNEIQTNALGHAYLVPGGWVIYYRGDADGNIAVDGDRIWRKRFETDGTTLISQDVIADHIVDNPDDETGHPKHTFIYWPDIYHLNSVEATVTVRESIGSRTAQATMVGEIGLRNR
jgi:type II secretory pathway pseudopilin PulG